MMLLYDRVHQHSKIPVNKLNTKWNWSFNDTCKSLKGILVLFEEEKPYTRDTSKFYNPKIEKVSVTIEGKPNQLYTEGTFTASTGVGKMHLALNLLESEYRDHFDFIVIICPTLARNETYKNRGWVWTDPDIIPIEPGNQLHHLIEKISKLLTGSKTLSLIDDTIADEALNKRHQPLLEMAISGRHRAHSLWLLTQSYTAVPNNIRRQAKMLYVWYPKNRTDLNVIQKDNDVIEMGELVNVVKEKLKQGKHTCLIMRMEHPRAYGVL